MPNKHRSTRDEPTGFVPVYLFHPARPGQTRRAGSPAQLTNLKADGWQVRKPVAITTANRKTSEK